MMMEAEGGDKEGDLPAIVVDSPEDLELRWVANVLWKVAREACRLCYNPSAKRAFKEACEANGWATPHNIRCDVVTRWNLTEETLEDTHWLWDGL
ncbi:hypothetical protein BDV93DRAFT_564874 [Ceratobasidium sp. AG-I]|nr:hypothetical protein BDV93DRAFT_564874 [Ceratobasidium sp. AG-I]